SFNVHRSDETGIFTLTLYPNTSILVMKKPKPIRSVLDQTLKSLEIDVPLKAHSIWHPWKEIVGESVALHAQPRSIRNRILFIDVSHSTWIQQLQFLKSTLIEKINAYLGEPLIEDIRFRLGKISPPTRVAPDVHRWEKEKLDQGTLTRIEELIQKIKDEETRKELREVLVRGAKLERSRNKTK
ncbi:MAG: DciA family protein, partial [Thermodesulfobacteriota bacterium]